MDHKYILVGYIAGDTFANRGNSHYANEDGDVVCGTTNRFGMDCCNRIRIVSYTEFYTEHHMQPFNKPNKRAGSFLDLTRNHLPMDCFITCKKCQKYIEKQVLK